MNNKFSTTKLSDEKKRLASDIVENSNFNIEKDADLLAHMISTDIRDSVPPQLYSLIAVIAEQIKRGVDESK